MRTKPRWMMRVIAAAKQIDDKPLPHLRLKAARR